MYKEKIENSGLTIYDGIDVDSELWIPTRALEDILNKNLKGFSVAGYPIKTRSKVVKEQICRILGYPVPKTFNKTKPRFPGQRFNTMVLKADNVQIWNEEIQLDIRFVMIRVVDDVITKVKVILGSDLQKFDTTGTLTQKYQAKLKSSVEKSTLLSDDTSHLQQFTTNVVNNSSCMPTDPPSSANLLSVSKIFKCLSKIAQKTIPDPGHDQERNRAAELHKMVCSELGYSDYRDTGNFPDIPNQLLEIKLQTSPTVDLGLISPDEDKILDIEINGERISNRDIRYAIFYGERKDGVVSLEKVLVTTGESFFNDFQKFEGNVTNTKIQMPIPKDFFD